MSVVEQESAPQSYDLPKKNRHNKWSIHEDMRLKEIVATMEKVNWKAVAKYFPNRNERQCYERWNYYLSPNVNNGAWSESEDRLLQHCYSVFGSQWMKISHFIPGRTNTCIKNRFLYLQRQKERLNREKEPPKDPMSFFDINNLIN